MDQWTLEHSPATLNGRRDLDAAQIKFSDEFSYVFFIDIVIYGC